MENLPADITDYPFSGQFVSLCSGVSYDVSLNGRLVLKWMRKEDGTLQIRTSGVINGEIAEVGNPNARAILHKVFRDVLVFNGEDAWGEYHDTIMLVIPGDGRTPHLRLSADFSGGWVDGVYTVKYNDFKLDC